MKIILYAIFLVSITTTVTKATGMEIPKDSKSEWDFRNQASPFLLGSESAKKLSECQTYEELRDTLEKAIPELIKSKW